MKVNFSHFNKNITNQVADAKLTEITSDLQKYVHNVINLLVPLLTGTKNGRKKNSIYR